jgi:hypothetical protein
MGLVSVLDAVNGFPYVPDFPSVEYLHSMNCIFLRLMYVLSLVSLPCALRVYPITRIRPDL